MDVLPGCMSVHRVHGWYPVRPEEGIISTGTELLILVEPPGGCWESNLGSLEKEPLPLTSEPPLWPIFLFLYVNKYILPLAIYLFMSVSHSTG